MRTVLGFGILLGLAGHAKAAPGLPSIDEPLRTGSEAPADTAVVIGVEDYAFVQDVPYAQRDAASVYDLLVYTVGVPSSRVQLFDHGASKEQILEAVGRAGENVGVGGSVWVYFAGHGAADPSTGGRMLLGDDVKRDATAFASRGVLVEDLTALASARGGAVNLIVDACYSGVGREGQELVSGTRLLVPEYAVASKPGVLEWSAASGDQLSGPLHTARHGAFTYLAVGALRGWADGQRDGVVDGVVTAEEAHLYVREGLESLQIHDQTPVLVTEQRVGRRLVGGDALEPRPELMRPIEVDAPATRAQGGSTGGPIASGAPVDPSACRCDGRLLVPSDTEVGELSKSTRQRLLESARGHVSSSEWSEWGLPKKVGRPVSGPRCPGKEWVTRPEFRSSRVTELTPACSTGRASYSACELACERPNVCLIESTRDGPSSERIERYALVFRVSTLHCVPR
ncbi:MAG: caspase family protein [Proteobacteria bacterium]|nr:caspase family protein [Pseudomonadota bacterium]